MADLYFQKYRFLSGKKQHCQEHSRRAAGELLLGELGASVPCLWITLRKMSL